MQNIMLPPRFERMPQFASSHMIDEPNSSQHTRLVHTHENELELLFISSGQGEHIIDGHVYEIAAGDMVVCNAGTLHGEDIARKRQMHSYCLSFTGVKLQGLPEGCMAAPEDWPVLSLGAQAEAVSQMMKLIHALSGQQALACAHIALGILLLIYARLQSSAEHPAKKQDSTAGLMAHRIQRYLDLHYAERLSLGTVSTALHISEYYLAHVFKDEYGIPPMQYVLKRRIGEAQTLLMDTNISIATISEQLGYENPANFSTVFRKYVGMSPSRYRRVFQQLNAE